MIVQAALGETGLEVGEGAQTQAGGELVLLVEDDGYVRDATTFILHELGYKVIAAEQAEIALEILLSGAPIDLLFTDQILPGTMNGGALIVEARRLRPNLRALLTSGHYDSAAAFAASLPGAPIQTLEKPFRREPLAAAVKSALAHSAS